MQKPVPDFNFVSLIPICRVPKPLLTYQDLLLVHVVFIVVFLAAPFHPFGNGWYSIQEIVWFTYPFRRRMRSISRSTYSISHLPECSLIEHQKLCTSMHMHIMINSSIHKQNESIQRPKMQTRWHMSVYSREGDFWHSVCYKGLYLFSSEHTEDTG